ncbi:hypothetical protein DFJ74DRAFT_654378 [Hyaloraphidium curvatum]|nr:hypothetical protein DFJ74DRAFT_654378 [Hyaloraphidium curvatum]
MVRCARTLNSVRTDDLWKEALGNQELRSVLKPFFNGGDLPEHAMPEGMVLGLAVAFHRRAYHLVRRPLLEFANLERRAAWGAFSLLATDNFGHQEMAQNTLWWDFTYFFTFYTTESLLRVMTEARPARRRVAEDVELLDRLALGIFLQPDFFAACKIMSLQAGPIPDDRVVDEGPPILERAVNRMADSLPILTNIVADHPTPWRRHNTALGRAGRFAPGFALQYAVGHFLERHDVGRDPPLFYTVHNLGHELKLLEEALGSKSAALTAYDRETKATLRTGDIADTCDKCGKVPEEGQKFKRCARCKSAWYCGAVCQREAWKA